MSELSKMITTATDYASVLAVYNGSDGEATRQIYFRLEIDCGTAGLIALNLFRATKCSERAKIYRGRSYKGAAYDRKQWSIANLCKVLNYDDARELGLIWGWGVDDEMKKRGEPFVHVLYIETPHGQVSFHSDNRIGDCPDFQGAWDRARGEGPSRVCHWVSALLIGAAREKTKAGHPCG